MKRSSDVRYIYDNLSVPGGGFVTGFVFHPFSSGILYARTDIGGIYRFDYEQRVWISLGDWLTEFDHHLSQPLSIAVDADRPNMLFAMCGNSRKGFDGGKAALLISDDYGASFVEKTVPFCCNGNSPARSAAERLSVKDGRLFYGSQGDGLWCSEDYGDSWKKLTFCQENIVFVWSHPQQDIMIVSATGETDALDTDRAHTLYASYDGGISFSPLTIPEPLNDSRCSHNGFVAGGIAYWDDKIYISFTHSYKSSWGSWNDFACDSGGGFDGRLYCYEISDSKIEFVQDITPAVSGFSDENADRRLPFGLGGIDVSGSTIAVCSIGGFGDGIFISRDSGSSYNVIKSTDLDRFSIDVPYLKPEYNGGRIPLHWMSCLRIDPYNADFAVINTGTGVFALNALTGDEPYATSLCYGIEETVHMNIYGIPSGKNKVIDLVGDLGGFAFRELSKPCENSFADENDHRYITCLNADYVNSDPDVFIATARGNWTGHTKGGVILTTDGGDSFTHIGYPIGISAQLDEAIDKLKQPNTNSGWAAISSDGKYILWTLAHKWMQLPCFAAVRYDIEEQKFTKVRIYDLNNNDISDSEAHIKIFSDRVCGSCFYGFGEDGQIYVSTDSGESFRQVEVAGGFPARRMSGIDGFKGGEIRFLPDRKGVCYIALLHNGLWKMTFDSCSATTYRVTDEGDFVKAVGFGAGSDDHPAIFISGKLFGGEYGFWRSYDGGISWAKINSDRQMYGHIISIDGDFRKRGRVYIATGCRGGFYGDEEI